MNKPGFVYFMANRKQGAIYTGSTSNLVNRTYQHRSGLIDGFTMVASFWSGFKPMKILTRRD
jgi:predicted GIY-YIG superfamily endonuclease